MTFHAKLLFLKNYWVLGSIKHMDLSKFMVELDIQYYFALGGMMQFIIELDIL